MKVTFVFLFAFIAIVSSTQYLSDYNAIVQGSFKSTSSDCEGRLIVGGDAEVEYYSVGSRLTQDCGRVDFLVGGDLVAVSGQAARGLVTVTGTIQTESWGTPCGPVQSGPLPFDIDSVFAQYKVDSTNFGNEPNTGSVTVSFTDLYLSGSESGINYFNVDGTILPSITGIHLDIPKDSWAVVNFQGEKLSFSDLNFFLSSTTDKQRVLYNFPDATEIYSTRNSFQGSIFAPSATFYASDGNMEGSVACANYYGNGEFHNYPYIPPETTCHCPPCTATINMPSNKLFSLFIHETISSQATDFQGRVAAGGDISFDFVGVGSKLPQSTDDEDVLITRGNLYFHDGEVSEGNILVQGTYDIERVGIPDGELINGNVDIPFDLDFLALTAISRFMSTWYANGEAIINYSTLDLYGTYFFLNVFDIDASTLNSARTIVLSVPDSSHVLINVNGEGALAFQNSGIVLNGANPDRILWNFFNTNSLSMDSIQIEGSLLAPYADVVFNNGNLNGAIFAKSYTGNGEIHLTSWEPLPVPCPPCDC